MRLVVLVLAGCRPAGTPALLTDADHDGALALVDCDDADPARSPGATEVPGDGVDQDCDGIDPIGASDPIGAAPDEAFGAAVTGLGSGWWAGAPAYAEGGLAMGRVWADGEVIATGAPGERLGAALAVTDDGAVKIGVPGAGEVRGADGAVLASGAGVGRVVVARGGRWATGTATGARIDGREIPWDAEPFSLAIGEDGAVYGGFPRSEVAVRGEAGNIPAGSALGEAGYALLLADTDGDGAEELLVGAPGEGAVYACGVSPLPASLAECARMEGEGGRFGASLAALPDGTVFVGAPMHAGGAGRVWSVRRPDPPVAWLDGADGDQLGFSLTATADGVVIAGAPGPASAPGMIRIRVP